MAELQSEVPQTKKKQQARKESQAPPAKVDQDKEDKKAKWKQ